MSPSCQSCLKEILEILEEVCNKSFKSYFINAHEKDSISPLISLISLWVLCFPWHPSLPLSSPDCHDDWKVVWKKILEILEEVYYKLFKSYFINAHEKYKIVP